MEIKDSLFAGEECELQTTKQFVDVSQTNKQFVDTSQSNKRFVDASQANKQLVDVCQALRTLMKINGVIVLRHSLVQDARLKS